MLNFVVPEFVWTIINFLALLAVLSHFLFKPVNKIIDERKQNVENTIKEAEEERKKAQELLEGKEKEYKLAKEEGKLIIEDYKARAEKVYQEIVSDAQKEAELILERSKKEIQREKEKAEDEMKTKVIDLSIELSQKALVKALDEAKQRELIEDFIAKVGD